MMVIGVCVPPARAGASLKLCCGTREKPLSKLLNTPEPITKPSAPFCKSCLPPGSAAALCM